MLTTWGPALGLGNAEAVFIGETEAMLLTTSSAMVTKQMLQTSGS